MVQSPSLRKTESLIMNPSEPTSPTNREATDRAGGEIILK